MALGKRNEVKVAIENYVHLIIGERKIGKSTLVAEIAKTRSSIDDLLVISVGDEDGFHAIDGLIYENPMTWKEFVDIVDELIQNQDSYDFRYVAIDTIDELISLGIKEVLRLHKIEKQTPVKSVNDAFGGYGRGKAKLTQIIGDQISRLKKSKYTLFEIGHNKVKELKDKGTGDPFNILTSNLTNDYFDIFAYKADIVCNIVTEKQTSENNKLEDVKRYMYFRSDGFVDAGSRFKALPNRVPYGAEEYIDAVEEGIKNSIDRKITKKEMEELKEKSIATKAKEAKEYVEKHEAEVAAENEEMELKAEVERLKGYITDSSKSVSKVAKAQLKDVIVGSFGKVGDATEADIDALKQCEAIIDADLGIE